MIVVGPKVLALEQRLLRFMDEHVFPAEPVYRRQEEAGDPYLHPPVMEELKREARAAGSGICFCRIRTGGPD